MPGGLNEVNVSCKGWMVGLALVGAPDGGERKDIDLELRALTGADSNLRQSSRSQGWSAAAITQAEGSFRHLIGEDLVGVEGNLLLDIGEGADRAHRLVTGVGGLWSRFLVGRARSHGLGPRGPFVPHLRVDVRASYRLGLRLDEEEGRPRPAPSPDPGEGEDELGSGEEEEEEEVETPADADEVGLQVLGSGSAIAFLNPHHDLSILGQALYAPWETGRFALRSRLRRSLRGREPGEAIRHFSEVAGRIRWRERLEPWVRVSMAYELAHRWYDERSDGRGGTLAFLTHRIQGRARFREGRFTGNLAFELRLREANRDGRSSLRHQVGIGARYELDRQFDVLAEFSLGHEERLGRPERNWTRMRGVAGVAINF